MSSREKSDIWGEIVLPALVVFGLPVLFAVLIGLGCSDNRPTNLEGGVSLEDGRR
jgi:hypothetical protein